MTVRLFGVCIYFRFEIHLASYQPKILDLIPVSFEGLLKYHHLMSFTGFNGPHWGPAYGEVSAWNREQCLQAIAGHPKGSQWSISIYPYGIQFGDFVQSNSKTMHKTPYNVLDFVLWFWRKKLKSVHVHTNNFQYLHVHEDVIQA